MTQFGARALRSARRARAFWRDGPLAGRPQPRWWPQRLVAWPGLRSPHADKEVVVFAGGRRYEFAPATMRGFSGHVHHGVRRPTTGDVAASLARLGLPVDVARTLATVSRFEGGYDSIQTYDSARFSWGFIQFSAPGGLYYVLEEIKSSQPATFASTFSPAGIDAVRWQVQVRRDGRSYTGRRAHDLLHDDPKLWTPFIAAAGIVAVQDVQTKVAHDHYYVPMMRATAPLGGREVPLGEVFAGSEIGRTLLFDRAVRRGPTGAVRLLRDVVERCGPRADDAEVIIDELLRVEAHDAERLHSIIDVLASAESEHG